MRFLTLDLYCPDLDAQRSFYSRQLEWQEITDSEAPLAYQVGYTRLRFREKADVPPYHFAFNIPAGQEAEALDWLKERTEIISFRGKDVIDFSNWEAYAMYFRDPAGNIVEFIARRPLRLPAIRPFSHKSIAGASEMGVAVRSIRPFYEKLHQGFGLELFDGSFDKFCAVGDHEGLFIVVDQATKDWFPAGIPAKPAPFSCTLDVDGTSNTLSYQPENRSEV